MALIGNRSVLLKSPGRFLSGTVASIERNNFATHGQMRSAYQSFSAISAKPSGHLSPSAWVLPKTAGGMSSVNMSDVSVGATGLAVGGITTDGAAAISFTVADATGQLIASGSGAAAMQFTVADALLTASLNAAGAASFAITTSPPLLGALASGDGSASMTFGGTLLPYATGSMSGSTVDSSVLTTEALIEAMNSNPPAVNVKKVNDVTVTGTGATGDEWGP